MPFWILRNKYCDSSSVLTLSYSENFRIYNAIYYLTKLNSVLIGLMQGLKNNTELPNLFLHHLLPLLVSMTTHQCHHRHRHHHYQGVKDLVNLLTSSDVIRQTVSLKVYVGFVIQTVCRFK
jgi:hypothetical protein